MHERELSGLFDVLPNLCEEQHGFDMETYFRIHVTNLDADQNWVDGTHPPGKPATE